MDPTRETLDAFIDSNYPHADQWAREESIYWLAYCYHSGQASNLYLVLSTSPFNPGPLSDGPEDEEAHNIFYDMVRHFVLD